ncbi:hypothetical protein MNEG_0390 [Monoraphidium neglectum]|uniref:SWIM-type domain-containing protein n=1 Tax=Monoraphidium neglectum TaxID=145388 RepID=A0A0D2KBJ8_9CHLO|nr:hypothetical protein MNEG_0390 [Monoraphidium neglectum]KIZ07553.1 hypothetical protein MNEG_0390 [Monoraphidium neglectum]|eukprot:XP_013906572.1 hypothetical protein MNEG_0390 [Monoraphidium neglectum]
MPRPKRAPGEPTRKSARLEGHEAEAHSGLPAGVEEGSDLAEFITTGHCPRCGRAQLSLEARQLHLARCKGPPEPPTEEEIAATAEAMRDVQKARLRELEMGGLVEWSVEGQGGEGAQKATFIVIGSKGDHYAVRFTTRPEQGRRPRTCECMDCRIRKHDCKHIRLILQQLGLDEPYQDWPQALERKVSDLQAADESDAERVKGQEERARERRQKAELAAQQAVADEASAEGEGQGEEERPGGKRAAATCGKKKRANKRGRR